MDGASESTSLQCEVCSATSAVTRLRKTGSPACRACKAFLQCSGSGKCLIDRSEDTAILLSEKFDRRCHVYCPKCRLDKCIQVGMKKPMSSGSRLDVKIRTSSKTNLQEALLDNNATINPESCSLRYCDKVQIYRHPEHPECSDAEKILTRLVNNASIVINRLLLVPLKFGGDTSTVTAIWPSLAERTRQGLLVCSSYVKLLPGYTMLPMGDRRNLFKVTFIDYWVLQAILPDAPNPCFFGADKETWRVILHHFPQMAEMDARLRDLSVSLNRWQPSRNELVILQALLFYQNIARADLISPNVAQQARQRIMMVMRAAMVSEGGNKFDLENRWSLFENLLYWIPSHTKPISEFWTDIACKVPDGIRNDALIYEMFSWKFHDQ